MAAKGGAAYEKEPPAAESRLAVRRRPGAALLPRGRPGERARRGRGTVLVEPHIMLPGPDAPTPQPLPITPLPDLDGEGLPEGETPLLPLE